MDAIEKLFHECETEWHPEGPVFETKAARKLYARLTEENERLREALGRLEFDEDGLCPVCLGWKDARKKHDSSCWLGKARGG